MRHNLDGEWYHGRQARWEDIRVPFLSAGNWSGMGLHLRGNCEAYLCSPLPHKRLRIHAGTHIHPYHSEEGRHDQLRWFDYWLKGADNGVLKEPPVKLQIRKGGVGITSGATSASGRWRAPAGPSCIWTRTANWSMPSHAPRARSNMWRPR
jgi:predicted acyl esterase